jgi:iron complex outermembrane receptor protein
MFAAPTMAAPVTTLAFNASYNISPNLIVSFDATNLTKVKRAYYRYSEEEQQKLDVSGRQLILAHSVRQRTVGRPVPTYDEAV